MSTGIPQTSHIDLTSTQNPGSNPVLFILPLGGSVVISFGNRKQAEAAVKNSVMLPTSAIPLYVPETSNGS